MLLATAVVLYLFLMGAWFLDGWDRMDDPPTEGDT